MDMKLKVAEYIAAAAKCCFENCGLGCEDICAMIETPPDKKWAITRCRASASPK